MKWNYALGVFLVFLYNILFADLLFYFILFGGMSIPIMMSENMELLKIYTLAYISIFILIKLLALPVMYGIIEKYSKNEYLINFINSLKDKSKQTRKIIFAVPIIPIILLFIMHTVDAILYDNHSSIWEPIIMSLVYYFIISWFSSYLVLFLYWDIKKKRENQKIQENSLSN